MSLLIFWRNIFHSRLCSFLAVCFRALVACCQRFLFRTVLFILPQHGVRILLLKTLRVVFFGTILMVLILIIFGFAISAGFVCGL